MPASLTTENSIFLHTIPAWHSMGYVSPEALSAEEVHSRIDSFYYDKRPVMVELDGEMKLTGDWAIVRSAMPALPNEAILGFVGSRYNILQPIDICKQFDMNVNQPIETMGFLGTNAERLFLTWVLPSFDVNGDEVELYGFLACGYDGKFGATLYVVTVRVVCSNTFALAVAEGENTKIEGRGKIWSGKHNSIHLERDLGIWMEHVQERAMSKSKTAAWMFNEMARKAIHDKSVALDLLFRIYPNPEPLPWDFPAKLRDEKQKVLDELTDKATRDRAVVISLFEGKGIEITPDAYGLFNAVTEYENHERVIKKAANYSILFGNRANAMTKAANVIMDFVRKE